MRHLICLLILLISANVFADDSYEIVSGGGGRIDVRRGKRRAMLFNDKAQLDGVKVDRRARTVTIGRNSECNGKPADEKMTFDQLEARLVNSESLALHRNADYAASAKGFETAVKLDPKWVTPAYNLACARTQLGDKAGGVAALAPWLASAPIATYVHVAGDAELRPLLDTAELKAVRAATPGTIHFGPKGLGGFAWAPDRKLVALVSSTSGYLSCATSSEIKIYDATTGREVTAATLQEPGDRPGDCNKDNKAIAAKVAEVVGQRALVVEKVLVDLGFSLATIEEGNRLPQGEDGRETVRFKQSKLGVLAIYGKVNILRGDKSVGTAGIHERFHGASYLPDAHVMIMESYRPSDMCAETRMDVVPIKD